MALERRGALQQDLPWRVVGQIFTSHDVRDALFGVVDDHGQLICPEAIGRRSTKSPTSCSTSCCCGPSRRSCQCTKFKAVDASLSIAVSALSVGVGGIFFGARSVQTPGARAGPGVQAAAFGAAGAGVGQFGATQATESACGVRQFDVLA